MDLNLNFDSLKDAVKHWYEYSGKEIGNEVDEMCFDNESFWYKTATAAMAAFTLYSSYLYGKEVGGTKGGAVTEGSDTSIKGGSESISMVKPSKGYNANAKPNGTPTPVTDKNG